MNRKYTFNLVVQKKDFDTPIAEAPYRCEMEIVSDTEIRVECQFDPKLGELKQKYKKTPEVFLSSHSCTRVINRDNQPEYMEKIMGNCVETIDLRDFGMLLDATEMESFEDVAGGKLTEDKMYYHAGLFEDEIKRDLNNFLKGQL